MTVLPSQPTIKLSPSDARMPQVGFGTWKHYGQKASDAVYDGIIAGYRLLDCAADYGNECECGAGLQRAIQNNIIERKDMWVVSKLWNTYHRKEHVRAAVERSLRDWGVDYFDIYYMHFPISLAYVPFETRYPAGWFVDGKSQLKHDPVPLRETWQALEELVDERLIRHLGVSNVNSALLTDLLSYARIKPSLLQIEIHPYNSQPRAVLHAQSHGLAVTAYSSFGPMGFLELNTPKSKRTPPLFTHPVITSVAQTHGVTPAQVILKWALQRGLAIIPKSNTIEKMEENLATATIADLGTQEMANIDALNVGLRFNDPADKFEGCHIFS